MELYRLEWQDEKVCIEVLGGFVFYMDCWRVNGILVVFRVIGDVFQKFYVFGEVDVVFWVLIGFEDYLLFVCDGFFDVVFYQEVVGFVQSYLMRQQGSGFYVVEELVFVVWEWGFYDNIMVMVVFFRDF